MHHQRCTINVYKSWLYDWKNKNYRFSCSKVRGVVSGTTGSLAPNAIGNITITGHKSYLLMNVGLSTAGWFRLYTDSASRTNDASRSVGEDPIAGSGVILQKSLQLDFYINKSFTICTWWKYG